jgi:DNA-binding LacI/PurR family transcriptional regulator
MSVTLKDIAAKAKVSISTVSRIINDDKTKPASPETAATVWRIVRELGYVPNQNARKLVYNQADPDAFPKTKALGCIFTSVSDTYNDPFFSAITRGIQAEAARSGYLIGYTYSSCTMTESALYNNLTAHPVDGAIVMGRFNTDFLQFLKRNIKNLVYTGLNYVGGGFDEVICDAYQAAQTGVKHLAALGHRKIGYLGAIPGRDALDVRNEHRFAGYRAVLEQQQLPYNEDYVKNIGLTTEAAYLGMQEMLKRKELPTALFCANDLVAIGAMKAIHEAGLKIPEEMAVIGIDDIDLAAYVRPALSTVRVPKEELGKFAVKILIDRIEGGHELAVKLDLPFKLIVRESCGGSG